MKLKMFFAKRIHLPGWVFLTAMTLYTELLLHFWNSASIVPARLAVIVLFSLGFGAAFGLLSALLPPKAEKWTAVVLGALMAVLCLLEHFLNDAYQVFMPLISVFATAEGVATGYFSTVMALLGKNLWRIALVLLPVILYAVFARLQRRSWKRLPALLLAAVVCFAAGFGTIHAVKLDVAQLSAASNFDGTVRAFGLNMGMVMDLTGGSGKGEAEFDLPEPTTAPTETTSPTPETEPASQETAPETVPPETTEPPVVYEPHMYDLDYAAMAEGAEYDAIAKLHKYVASLTPAMENEYTGMFAGKNLILITAEAFTAEVIDPELTPTLYRLATEGIQFTDYYHPVWGCGTTGGEFANVVGMIPYGGTTTMMEAVEQDLFLTMGNQLQKLGYYSAAFHNNDHTYYGRNDTHTYLGYDTFFAHGNGMEELITNCWTRSDLEMVDVTLPEYLDKEPFSLYYMTVSGHSSYTMSNAMSKKNYHLVEHLPYSEPVKCYLAANMELEHAMASMIAMLEEAGIADDTVIVISADHYPYGLAGSDTWGDGRDHVAELFGVRWVEEMYRDHNALIIWSGSIEGQDIVVEDPVSALDILPTLSNLFGLEYDSRLMIGRDVFSDSEPLVFWPLSYSWKTDKGDYDASTATFTPREGVEVDEDYVSRISSMVQNKALYSRLVQQYNYFRDISIALGFTEDGRGYEG